MLKEMWDDPDKAAIFRENQSETAKKTSARADVQAERAERLKNWRDNNPEEFYEKCTSKAFASAKRKTKPEKWFHKYADKNLQEYTLKYSQSLYSEKMNTKSNRKQIDFMSKDRRVWVEIDGPLHFKTDYYQYSEIKRKDLIVNQIANNKDIILIRISFDQWNEKTGIFKQSALDKIQEILKEDKPGIYKIGKEYE